MLFLKLKGRTGKVKNGGKKERKKITALLLVFLEIFHLFYMTNVQSKACTKGKVILTTSVRCIIALKTAQNSFLGNLHWDLLIPSQTEIMMKFLHGLN